MRLKGLHAPIAILGFLASFLLLTQTASANLQTISIQPSAINQTVQPGSVYNGSLQVSNRGQDNYPFHVYASPYSVKNYSYSPDFIPIPGRPNVANWLKFSLTQASLKPNQSINLNYSLSVPKHTLPGGYYAVAFAQTKSLASSNGLNFSDRVGCIFYLQVAGPAKHSGKVLSWQTNLLQTSRLSSTLLLENSGSVHYQSSIDIKVRDIFNNPKDSYESEKIVLPQTIRRVVVSWANPPVFALLKVNGTATINGQTKTLGAEYVLVMSRGVKVILIIIVAALALVSIRYILRARLGTNKVVKRP